MGRHILFIAAVHKRLTFLTMESAVFEFAIGLELSQMRQLLFLAESVSAASAQKQ